MERRRHGTQGFTLLEVIVVLVLIGIISVIVFSRFENIQADLIGQTAAVKTHLRYAQARSMNSDSVWGIHSDSASKSYWLFHNSDISQRVTLPGADADHIDLGALGISIAQGGNGTFTVAFDDLGRPSNSAGGDPISASDLTLLVGKGAESLDITVTANTGFIP